MIILFNDIIQYSDAPEEIKSPALADLFYYTEPIIINLENQYLIDSIGIGSTKETKGKNFTFSFNDSENTKINFTFETSGLYIMKKPIKASQIIITTDAEYIGRIGAGIGCRLPTAIKKEPSYRSTSAPRTTLAGQEVRGAGGYNFRALSLDVNYKITKDTIEEIEKGLKYIGEGYPFFIDLSTESYKLPFNKLYAIEKNQLNMTLQSAVKRFLYSYRFDFEERF